MLSKEELIELFKTDPELAEKLISQNREDWLKWAIKNPELAQKIFPEEMKKLMDIPNKSHPIVSANMIQDFPKQFHVRKSETEKLFGLTKQKEVQNQIVLIDVILGKNFINEIEKYAVESVKDELLEQREYWENELKSLELQKSDQTQRDIPLKLDQFFETTSKYKFIMELLVKKGLCQPNTYIWKDEGKGNKGYLVAILKYLHKQGYYRDNKKLTNEQIHEIVENTFGWRIGIDTIKKTKSEDFDLPFIPLATTI